MPTIFTSEMKEFIEKNVVGKGSEELTRLINNHFETNLKVSQVQSFKVTNKLKSGVDTTFKKGHTENKGKKLKSTKRKTSTNKGQFKAGHRPHNTKPVGEEVVNNYGYTKVKVAEPNEWKFKHTILWEEENGPVPQGCCIVFSDGNRANFNPDNLILVTREELVMMNDKGLMSDDPELTKTGHTIAKIYAKLADAQRRELDGEKEKTTTAPR